MTTHLFFLLLPLTPFAGLIPDAIDALRKRGSRR